LFGAFTWPRLTASFAAAGFATFITRRRSHADPKHEGARRSEVMYFY
jgi:hypothetical protein